MGTFTRKEIVLFPFPHTDLGGTKIRPCLILSKAMGGDIVLCQITSQEHKRDKYYIALPKNKTIYKELAKDSYIRSNMWFTATTKQIICKIDAIGDEIYRDVVAHIIELINLQY